MRIKNPTRILYIILIGLVVFFGFFLSQYSVDPPKGDVLVRKNFIPAINHVQIVSGSTVQLTFSKPSVLPSGKFTYSLFYNGVGDKAYSIYIDFSQKTKRGMLYEYIAFSSKDIEQMSVYDNESNDCLIQLSRKLNPTSIEKMSDSLLRLSKLFLMSRLDFYATFPSANHLSYNPLKGSTHLLFQQIIREKVAEEPKTNKYVLLTPAVLKELRFTKVLKLQDTFLSDNHAPGKGYRQVNYTSWNELEKSLRKVRSNYLIGQGL